MKQINKIPSIISLVILSYSFLLNFNTHAQQQIYGLAPGGGIDGGGLIFKLNDDLTGITSQKEFPVTNPGGLPHALAEGKNGKLYGVTGTGGFKGNGVIFEYDPETDVYEKKIDLNLFTTGRGSYGRLVEASTGKFYGMTSTGGTSNKGTIFEYDYEKNIFTHLYDFNGVDGENPRGSLVAGGNGKLYGVSSSGGLNNLGLLFEYDIEQKKLITKFDFSSSQGAVPYADIIKAKNGKLYGMTVAGGFNNYGVIFSYDLANNFYSKVDLTENSGGVSKISLIEVSDGLLVGITASGGTYGKGTVFEYSYLTNQILKTADLNDVPTDTGFAPGSLINVNGYLYGITYSGGPKNLGIIYEYNLSTHDFIKKFEFTQESGSHPEAELISTSKGKVYGTTEVGGIGPQGTLFEYDFKNNVVSKKLDFSNSISGQYPAGSIIQASNGKFYGMTSLGGTNGGTLYEYNPFEDNLRSLVDFKESFDGSPLASLVQAKNGNLYGFKNYYNSVGQRAGYLFEYDILSGICKKLLDTLGSADSHSLINGSNGNLFGIINYAGEYQNGLLFEYNPVTHKIIKSNSLEHNYGFLTDITIASNGKFYLVGNYLPTNQCGGILEWNTSTNLVTVATEVSSNICTTYGALTQAGNGKFYGLSYNGGINNQGTLYQFDPLQSEVNTKINFEWDKDGGKPTGSLIQANGKLYGVTEYGGPSGNGVIFEYNPELSIITNRIDNVQPVKTLTAVDIKLLQDVTFTKVLQKYYGDVPFLLDANASSGLPITYRSSDPSIVTIEGSTATIHNAGTCKIFAMQEGNEDYYAADQSCTLVVHKATQTITFPSIEDKNFKDKTFTPNATASSLLAISYESDNEEVAQVDGSIINFISPGEALITAKQDGNENFESAVPVTQKLTVKVITSIEDPFGGMELFPNPSKGIISLRTSSPINSLTLTDVTGRCEPVAVNNGAIDISKFEKGLYFLTVESSGNIKVVKIIRE